MMRAFGCLKKQNKKNFEFKHLQSASGNQLMFTCGNRIVLTFVTESVSQLAMFRSLHILISDTFFMTLSVGCCHFCFSLTL